MTPPYNGDYRDFPVIIYYIIILEEMKNGL